MSIYRNTKLVLVLVPILAGCITFGERTDPAIAAALDIANEAFSTAYLDGDMETLVGLYTEDARLMPPGRVVEGRDAIRAYFTNPNRRQIEHDMIAETLRVRGAMAVETGTWTNTYQEGDAEPVTASDQYLLVWLRQPDGTWKIFLDMWHRPSDPS